MSNNAHKRVIELLEKFIENHEAIKSCKTDEDLFKILGVKEGEYNKYNKSDEYLTCGLCKLIFNTATFNSTLEEFDNIVFLKYKVFRSWKYFSGNDIYPVADRDEYYKIKNIADNPLRLDLAKHLLEGFKEAL